ncbi:MAG: transposase [Aquificaceae bacterium]|nr:transposase [Aquificaceae bacterium]
MVRRGEMLDAQSQNKQAKKLGRPSKCPRSLILLILFFKYVFRLPYRQAEGFAKALFRDIVVSIPLPNFRTIHYRHNREEFQFDHLPDNPKDLPQDFVIVLDSTSIKLTNRGEWLSKKHGKKRRKGGIKVHVAIDISSGRVLHMKVTDNKTHDSQCAVELVENSVKKAEAGGCEVTRK